MALKMKKEEKKKQQQQGGTTKEPRNNMNNIPGADKSPWYNVWHTVDAHKMSLYFPMFFPLA